MGVPKLLTVDEVAEVLGVSPQSVRHMVYRRQIPHLRVGGRRVRFDAAEIADWLAAQRVGVAG